MTKIVTGRRKSKRVGFPFNKETMDHVEALAIHFKMKRSQVLAKILNDFLNDSELQNAFTKYASSRSIMFGRNEAKKPLIQANYTIHEDILKKIEKMRFDFKFIDFAPFIRTIIHFFHDLKLSYDFKKEIQNISRLLVKEGYQVIDCGTMDNKIYFIVSTK